MHQDSAEVVALQALGWIVSDPEILSAFLGASGATASELPARAQDTDFHEAILDFLLMDDQWVIGFCDVMGLAYTVPMAARLALSGGAQANWT